MIEGRKLYELISMISRRHGLLALDPPSRLLLDSLIDRESSGIKTTAGDLIKATGLSRALVYRKLSDLKKNGWINEEWVDYKLCYTAGAQCQSLFKDLSKTFAPKIS